MLLGKALFWNLLRTTEKAAGFRPPLPPQGRHGSAFISSRPPAKPYLRFANAPVCGAPQSAMALRATAAEAARQG